MKKTNKLAAYEILDGKGKKPERHTIAILVDNEFGVLARVIELFSARGYNIESLTVSEVDHQKSVSRITVITQGTPDVINQIMALLDRIVPVYEVRDLTVESPHIEREVGLIKIVALERKKRAEAQKLADRFGARTIDSTRRSFIFELSDTPEKIDKFIRLMRPLGIKEICRTGATAIARGDKGLKTEIR